MPNPSDARSMIAKRLGAVGLALALIAGAIFIRNSVLDGDGVGGGSGSDQRSTQEVVCITELATLCRTVGDQLELTVIIEQAGVTLDRLVDVDNSEIPVWITIDPYPAMLDQLRSASRNAPVEPVLTTVASSPTGLVMTPSIEGELTVACGEPIDWACLGDQAAAGWARTGFASSTQSAFGLIGVVNASAGYFTPSAVMPSDTVFQLWLRSLLDSVNPNQVSSGTAIATIQIRPSSMSVAVGPTAQLGNAQQSTWAVQYAEPMIRTDVVVAVPAGASVPDRIDTLLSSGLAGGGWDPAANTPNPMPSVSTVLAINSLWEELA